VQPNRRTATCTLKGGRTLVFDPSGIAEGSTSLEDFESNCGSFEDNGLEVVRPCNTRRCETRSWSVGPWTGCTADCGKSEDGRTARGVVERVVECEAGDRLCGTQRPPDVKLCTIVCDACANSQPCGPYGKCKCVSSNCEVTLFHIFIRIIRVLSCKLCFVADLRHGRPNSSHALSFILPTNVNRATLGGQYCKGWKIKGGHTWNVFERENGPRY
jgi:hypothetical protein